MQNTSFDTLIPDGVPELANDSMQLISPWGNINSGNLGTISFASGGIN